MLPFRTYEERPSDSPFVDKIGHFYAEGDFSHLCPADVLWNMLLVRYKSKTSFTVWGPETQSGQMRYPEGAEFLFIRFKLGTFMPHLPVKVLVNRGAELPEASSQSFWLDSTAWQVPDYENADTFVAWLVKAGLLVREPVVDAVMRHQSPDLSLRVVQRRFLQATGVTHMYIRQIERARQAVTLLQQGVSILDTVCAAGYFDQPHLTRSLKRFIGQTPAQIAAESKTQ